MKSNELIRELEIVKEQIYRGSTLIVTWLIGSLMRR